MAGLRARIGAPLGAAVSAAAFTAYHLQPDRTVSLMAMGLVAAWLYDRAGSLRACYSLRAAANAVWARWFLTG